MTRYDRGKRKSKQKRVPMNLVMQIENSTIELNRKIPELRITEADVMSVIELNKRDIERKLKGRGLKVNRLKGKRFIRNKL